MTTTRTYTRQTCTLVRKPTYTHTAHETFDLSRAKCVLCCAPAACRGVELCDVWKHAAMTIVSKSECRLVMWRFGVFVSARSAFLTETSERHRRAPRSVWANYLLLHSPAISFADSTHAKPPPNVLTCTHTLAWMLRYFALFVIYDLINTQRMSYGLSAATANRADSLPLLRSAHDRRALIYPPLMAYYLYYSCNCLSLTQIASPLLCVFFAG